MAPEPVVLEDYAPAQSAEAMALERLCPQGRSLRLGFRRPAFHRRAQTFRQHRILLARSERRLAGTLAVAIKEMQLCGRPLRGAFLFDLRVHPELRGRGVARRLVEEALGWGLARAELAYTYSMADNAAIARLGELLHGRDAGGYSYLVVPAGECRPAREPVAECGFDEVHAEMLRTAGPFDLYADPAGAMRDGPWVGSWRTGRAGARAGCSAWDNSTILAEVVERLPLWLRAAGALLGSAAARRLGWPRLPRPGAAVRSWYLFDFFASDAAAACDLVRHLRALARARGVDYLYLPHAPGDPAVNAVRGELPRLLAPLVPYRLILRLRDAPTPALGRVYVDVRDL